MPRRRKRKVKAEEYRHVEATNPMRPDAGTQAQFKKKKPPTTYRYDSSLAPEMNWDGQNPARELGEWLLACIDDAAQLDPPHQFAEPREFKSSDGTIVESVDGLHDAVAKLKALGEPFLNWAGKAERLSFDVPTLPLFVHERLSTQAVIDTLKSHRKDRVRGDQMALFADPQHSVSDQVLKAYEYQDEWVNRLILGDSRLVMNSLLRYEGLGGQVQMIYMDPPYGVKFGSNFQPFVRSRNVKNNDDDSMTREPEMVQAYRDTWELGLHSYLSYMRDRLLLSRELLHPSGSIFVQIGDENVQHVRELLDEVFGPENFCSLIAFVKTSGFSPTLLSNVADYLLWYAKDKERVSYNQLVQRKEPGEKGATQYSYVEDPTTGEVRPMTSEEEESPGLIPSTHRILCHDNLTAQGASGNTDPFEWRGETFDLPANSHWKTTQEGLQRLAAENRLMAVGSTLRYKRYLDDFPVYPVSNVWTDTAISGFADKKTYVVQTNPSVVERCLLMTSNPGDLVLDPTCGSGTTARAAEQWGRRWITTDVSRVPLALTRQRLLTATYPWYELRDETRGPGAGFMYEQKQDKAGREIGGIVPHKTLKSIANDEEPDYEILVDRPEQDSGITRVSGPFVVEATIPTPVDWDADGEEDSGVDLQQRGAFVDRMLEVLRKSPVLRMEGNQAVTLKNVRTPAKTLSLNAEATVQASDLGAPESLGDIKQQALEDAGESLRFSDQPVAIVFGPENGAVSEKLVYEAAREANAKSYARLFVIGFAIEPNARKLVENCEDAVGVPASYAQMTPDLLMGDLLKNMRSSEIFSVCGLPEIELNDAGDGKYQVKLLGLDTFDPATMKAEHMAGDDVPAWFLDTDYNGLCFHVCQAFFPRTHAWDSIKKALKTTHDPEVWDHLAGNTSAPFEPGEHNQVAVKVIDDRGNELLVVKDIEEAE